MIPRREDVRPGVRLIGKFKGKEVRAQAVVSLNPVSPFDVMLESGVVFGSLSLAARAVTGFSTDGWHFWSVED